MFKCAKQYDNLNNIQHAMIEIQLLQEDPFFPTLKRLVKQIAIYK